MGVRGISWVAFEKYFLWDFCGGRATLRWWSKPRSTRDLGVPPVGRARRTLAPPFGSGGRSRPAQKTHKKKLCLAIRERAESERLTLPELGDRFWRSWSRVLVHFEAWSPGGGSLRRWSSNPWASRYSEASPTFLYAWIRLLHRQPLPQTISNSAPMLFSDRRHWRQSCKPSKLSRSNQIPSPDPR